MLDQKISQSLHFVLAVVVKSDTFISTSMNPYRKHQHSKPANVLRTDYTGMLISAELGLRPSDSLKAFRPNPGGVKNIAA